MKSYAKKEKKNGLTTKNMAELLHYKSSSTYAKKEREEIPINIEDARKICIILNTTMDEIFLDEKYLNKIKN